jgi:RNase P subunit RPR2
MDTLSNIRDEVYENLYLRGLVPDKDPKSIYIDGHFPNGENWTPRHRLYGYTIFAETDDFWREEGLDPTAPSSTLIPQLMKWIVANHQYSNDDVFTTDENYKDENNLLYQWTTYHILPFRTPADRLVFHRNEFGYSSATQTFTIPMYEIYSTMGKRRLIKIYESRESNGIYLNRFPNLETNRTEVLHELSCDPDKEGCFVDRDPNKAVLNDIINCCIYPIGAPLSYNDNVRNNLEFEAINKEIEFQNLEIQLCERRNRDSNNKIKELEQHIQAAELLIKKCQAELDSKKAELDGIIEETKKDEVRFLNKSAEQEKYIDEHYLNAYKRIRKQARNGLAVVTIDRDACGGCFSKIPPQRQSEIKMHKKVIVCEHCGRMLVDDDIAHKAQEQLDK